LPDLTGIVLDPARTRKDLWKLPLADGDDRGIVIEDDGARARRALIEGEDVWHYSGSENTAGEDGILLEALPP
jgi:hypothetical protein